MPFNTLYQLLAARMTDNPSLKKAQKLIFMADLVSYYLCGRKYAEYTTITARKTMLQLGRIG